VPDLTYFSPKVESNRALSTDAVCSPQQPLRRTRSSSSRGGYVFTREQRDRVGQDLGPSEIQITETLFIGPTTPAEHEGGMMHLNHSCEPNLGLQGRIVFVATRDIAAGEELTIDYAMTDDEPYEMTCHCGSKDCRGLITGFDWGKPELQKRYDR
jgi:uncharacterized protein